MAVAIAYLALGPIDIRAVSPVRAEYDRAFADPVVAALAVLSALFRPCLVSCPPILDHPAGDFPGVDAQGWPYAIDSAYLPNDRLIALPLLHFRLNIVVTKSLNARTQ